jgi:hypothetical protein
MVTGGAELALARTTARARDFCWMVDAFHRSVIWSVICQIYLLLVAVMALIAPIAGSICLAISTRGGIGFGFPGERGLGA